jgi:hypothetical protein
VSHFPPSRIFTLELDPDSLVYSRIDKFVVDSVLEAIEFRTRLQQRKKRIYKYEIKNRTANSEGVRREVL